MSDNKRDFFRLTFEHPLCSDLKIVGAYGKELDSKKTRVLIRDISAGGLRFASRLNLPADAGLLLEFRFMLLDKEIRVVGVIQRRWENEPELSDYGVKFTIFEQDEITLAGVINLLATKLKRTPTLSSCSFCSATELDFMYGRDSAVN